MINAIDLPQLLTEIEKELVTCIGASQDPRYAEYEKMFAYQMDWEKGPRQSRGKRVRPLLVLLTTHAVGGEWQKALPAAASLELMHNFSLIHDDIQDQSDTRRGKPTIWVKWGEPLAINAGDALLAISSLCLQRLLQNYSPQIVMKVSDLTHNACLNLTRGQYLDIAFEASLSVNSVDYFEMIKGKTCALLAAALEIGGLLGGADETQCQILHACGTTFGQAYQIQDDWLGIWGDAALTGKSTQSDLLTRKKSFPILIGLERKQSFYKLWTEIKEITPTHIPSMVKALVEDGVKEETEFKMNSLYTQTQSLLFSVQNSSERLLPLTSMLNNLMNRAQ